jgi:dihydrofolate synthase/folylpolyglutamate synthase
MTSLALVAERARERSQNPRVDGVLERLLRLYPRAIDLDMGRLRVLLEKLGHPERRLAPVLHVAGTNGKGSTCAFARAIAEAAGLRTQVYTSPHLVDFNERIRLTDGLVDKVMLAETLEAVERVNAGAAVTVFEVITAAAFRLFAADPADLCILEVGLGGRGDATNVIDRPAVCAITAISIDHRDFLGDSLSGIAAEKAGIIKPGVPVVTGVQAPEVLAVIAEHAAQQGARLFARNRAAALALTCRGASARQCGHCDSRLAGLGPRPSGGCLRPRRGAGGVARTDAEARRSAGGHAAGRLGALAGRRAQSWRR